MGVNETCTVCTANGLHSSHDKSDQLLILLDPASESVNELHIEILRYLMILYIILDCLTKGVCYKQQAVRT